MTKIGLSECLVSVSGFTFLVPKELIYIMLAKVTLLFIFELTVVYIWPLFIYDLLNIMLPSLTMQNFFQYKIAGNLVHIHLVLFMTYLGVLFRVERTDQLFVNSDRNHVNNFKTRIRKGYS